MRNNVNICINYSGRIVENVLHIVKTYIAI